MAARNSPPDVPRPSGNQAWEYSSEMVWLTRRRQHGKADVIDRARRVGSVSTLEERRWRAAAISLAARYGHASSVTSMRLSPSNLHAVLHLARPKKFRCVGRTSRSGRSADMA